MRRQQKAFKDVFVSLEAGVKLTKKTKQEETRQVTPERTTLTLIL